ncbi:MAG: YraN family protein [candidate division WOR-3 bacterium]
MEPLGKQGEKLAVKFLKTIGYKILAQNYRCALGEIDIIAQDKNTLVFIEVKTRKSDVITKPFESIGQRKQLKLRSLAEFYLQEKEVFDREIRFDVLSIVHTNKGNEIEHIINAF